LLKHKMLYEKLMTQHGSSMKIKIKKYSKNNKPCKNIKNHEKS